MQGKKLREQLDDLKFKQQMMRMTQFRITAFGEAMKAGQVLFVESVQQMIYTTLLLDVCALLALDSVSPIDPQGMLVGQFVRQMMADVMGRMVQLHMWVPKD